MRTQQATWIVATGALALALLAPAGAAPAQAATAARATAAAPTCQPLPSPRHFVDEIDNRYFPLDVGTVFTYRGTKDDAPLHDVMKVTDRTKKILGVSATVVLDTVTDQDGALLEQTLDWYAQDDRGNVWYMGEDSKQYENGHVVSTEGSWQAGVNGAKAGIIMEAHPQVGDTYRQECAAGVAEDTAQVLKVDASITVPFGTFHRVLQTKETSPLDPGTVEHKYYARGVGDVREIDVKGGTDQLQLVSVRVGDDSDEPGDGADGGQD